MNTSNETFVYPITKELCLYGIELKRQTEKEVRVRVPVNQILIFDRSGSMTWLLDSVCDDLIYLVNELNPDDYVTIGWFSSQGKFSWMVIGARVKESKDAIVAAINKMRQSVALTCFSEILNDTYENVIGNLSSFSKSFALTFQTDGYPVVDNVQKEMKAVIDVLRKIGSKISTIKFIGYGDYYNKSFMVDMANASGGSLVHASHVKDMTNHIRSMIKGEVAESRIPVTFPKDPGMIIYEAFITTNKEPIAVPVEDNVAFVPEGTRFVFALSNFRLAGFNSPAIKPETALRSAAYLEAAATRSDNAMDILADLGDVYLVKSISSAWTNDEFGRAQEYIAESIGNIAARYIEGHNHSYVVDPNAFCLFDALNALMKDPKAYFYPLDPAFEYKRTGVATHTKEGYPKFEAENSTSCSFSKLVWNSTRLNLGVLTQIPGEVDLGSEAYDFNFDRYFHTIKWRNYTIVKDGVLNTTMIPASMSESTFKLLKENGMIAEVPYTPLRIYYVDLTAVPLINRSMAKPISSKNFCSWLIDELTFEYRQKVMNWILNEIDPQKESRTMFSPDQVTFLASKGINAKGEYAPPTVSEEPTDYYLARTFDVKISKFSSAPKVKDVLDKMLSNKSMTPSESLMADALKWYGLGIHDKDVKEVIKSADWAVLELESIKSDLAKIRRTIQSAKFSILLCKKWFTDLTDRDGAVVNLGDYQFTFSLGEKKVDY